MSTFQEYLIEILKTKGMSQNHFAQKLGYSRQNLFKKLSENRVNLNDLETFCKILDFDGFEIKFIKNDSDVLEKKDPV